jgi:hypothetical protein
MEGCTMPVLEASALNDNDENLAFLRAILAPNGVSAGEARQPRVGLREGRGPTSCGPRRIEIWTPDAQDRLHMPTIIGAVVSITTSPQSNTRLGSRLRPVPHSHQE